MCSICNDSLFTTGDAPERPMSASHSFRKQRRAEHIHPVPVKQALNPLHLVPGESFVLHLFLRRQSAAFAQRISAEPCYRPKERLHLTRGLINVDDFAGLALDAAPYVRCVARDKYG